MTPAWPLSWPPEWKRSSGAKTVETADFTPCNPGALPAGVITVKGEQAGIRRQTGGASGGPTGAAWVDSNGWHIRLARMQNPGKTVWVESEPPKAGEVVTVEQYLIGVADAGAHGGRWVVVLDEPFRRGVAEGKADALRDWERIRAAVRFFGAHAAWDPMPGRAVLGVLSDYAGDNEFLAGEILNLAARQQLPYQLLDKKTFQRVPATLSAVVYPDAQPPAPPARAALAQFAEAGGLLIVGQAWGKPSGEPLPESPTIRYSVYPSGKGRIAVAKEMDDPYLVAADAQVLLSHRNDIARLWNGGSLGMYVTGDARRSVVHLVNYTGRAFGDPVSLWVAGQFRSAMLYSLDSPEGKVLPVVPQRGGAELHLPPVPVYAAVEVS